MLSETRLVNAPSVFAYEASYSALRVAVPTSDPFAPQAWSDLDYTSELVLPSSFEGITGMRNAINVVAILDDAVLHARRGVARYPVSPLAWSSLGLALLNVGKAIEAASALEKALSIDEHLFVAITGYGHALLQLDDLERAWGLFQKLRETYPSHSGPLLSLAAIAARRGDNEQAAQLWRGVLVLNEQDLTARYQLGMTLVALGRYEEAIDQLEVAVAWEGQDASFHHGLGIAYAENGDRQAAIHEFEVALRLSPHMRNAVYGLAQVFLDEKRAAAAAVLLDRHFGTEPQEYPAQELLFLATLALGKFGKARRLLFHSLRTVEALGKSGAEYLPRVFNNLGVCYIKLGSLADGISMFKRAIEAHPKEPVPYHNLVLAYAEQRRWREIEMVLREGLLSFPHSAETYLLLARVYQEQGRYDEAIKEFGQLVELDEAHKADGDASVLGELYTRLAALLVDYLHEPAAAVALLSKVAHRFELDGRVTNNLAYAYIKNGNLGKAQECLDSAKAHVVQLPATRGLLALYKGDFVGAEKSYREAGKVALAENNPLYARMIIQKMHLEFALAYRRVGKNALARDHTHKGLSIRGHDINRRNLEALDKKLLP